MVDSPHRIAFRADASPTIGGGHVMRCLTLAAECARRGAKIVFLTTAETTATVPALVASSFARLDVAADPATSVAALNRHWPDSADVLVVDGYAMAAPEHRILRQAARRLMVIDDLANRSYDCDILLDQNLGRKASDYAGLVPAHCRVLAGTEYTLMRPEFAVARPAVLARREAAFAAGEPVRRILVSLGLTDVGGVTEQVVRAVVAAETGALIDVVLGSRSSSLPALKTLAAERREIALHIDTADMCQLMVAADLAVGAAGSSSWERCCLGLPTVMLVLAENQRGVAAALAAQGAAISRPNDDPASVIATLRRLSLDNGARAALSRQSAQVCDGVGAARVAAALAGSAGRPIYLRRAEPTDSEAIWIWRNDPETRRQSKTTDVVAWATHRDWLQNSLADPERIIWIACKNGEPVGMVRLDRNTPISEWLVSIAVAPERRGEGIGRRMLAAACATAAGATGVLIAEIRAGNRASIRIFDACGFIPSGASATPGFDLYRRPIVHSPEGP